jgi:para-nitrobenzyl esterase
MSDTKTVVVGTRSGKIEGVSKEGLFVFKGVPYAAPPVGRLRWLPPAPVTPWSGVRSALQFGGIAPQNSGMDILEGFGVVGRQDEDCLFLNIWTPRIDDGRRPVLVWVHGGAFNIGSGSQPFYRGKSLVSRGDVVVVTVNYRLGMLGFLNLNEVTGGRIPSTGNEGLLDQIAALAWVQENISSFGGNPDNVTLFGESAGGMSIGCLMAMPRAGGLFHKAILESGVGNTAFPKEAAVTVSRMFLDAVDAKPNDVEVLRALPVEKLLAGDTGVKRKLAGPGEVMRATVTAPVIDGIVLPQAPIDALTQDTATPVPAITGSNLEEWRLFASMGRHFPKMDESQMLRKVQAFIPAEHASSIIDLYRKARFARGESTLPLDLTAAVLTDLMFRIPGLQVVEALKERGVPVYNYLFNWKSPAMGGLLGACHVLEIGFVFGTHNGSFCGSGPEADGLSRKMQDAWTSFARNGDPSCDSLGVWPPYGDGRLTMILGKGCHVEEAPLEEERRVWEQIGQATRSSGPQSLP